MKVEAMRKAHALVWHWGLARRVEGGERGGVEMNIEHGRDWGMDRCRSWHYKVCGPNEQSPRQ